MERAYSAYKMLVRDGWERLSFADSLKNEERRSRERYRMIWRYREAGLYADQVRAFQENFSHVQILLYDELRLDGDAVIRSVYRFLDVDPEFIPDIRREYNVSGIPRWSFFNALFVKPKRLHKAVRTIGWAILGEQRWIRPRDRFRSAILQNAEPMDPAIEQQLRRFFREDILKLQDYTGRDLSTWMDKRPA